MSRVDIKRDTPVPDTHLTEAQLTELWYTDLDRLRGNTLHRQYGRLFPRSRKDLIAHYTEQDLANNVSTR